MVLLALSKISSTITRAIGPSLFRTGLFLRTKLATANNVNNYWIDMLFLIPYSQKLLSLAIYEESKERVSAFSQPVVDTTAAISSTAQQRSEIRLSVWNEILRPSLLPHEQWGPDIDDSWRYHSRLVAWLRKEFLIQKYGPFLHEAMDAYPALRRSPQLQPSGRRRFLMDLMHRGVINIGDSTTTSDNNSSSDASFFQRLPLSETVIKAFGMRDWSVDKHTQRVRQATLPVVEKLGGTINFVHPQSVEQQVQEQSNENRSPKLSEIISSTKSHHDGVLCNHAVVIPPQTNLTDTPLEDILEVVTGGYVANCGPLNAICQEANFYQLWTREYVQHLGDYLWQRSRRQCQQSPSRPDTTIILDVGAGDGLLIQCLRDYMEQKESQKSATSARNKRKTRSRKDTTTTLPTLVATDDMSWNIFTKAKVEKLSVKQALQKYARQATMSSDDKKNNNEAAQHEYNQVIILCSWMPMGEDWTALFRDGGVDEYILIGEADDGSCGHNWWTWGNAAFLNYDASSDQEKRISIPMPYEQDGYQRWDMDVLRPFQFSSFDCALSKSSKTVSFRKKATAC